MFGQLLKLLGRGVEEIAKPIDKVPNKLPYITPGGMPTDMRPVQMDKPMWEQQLLRPQPNAYEQTPWGTLGAINNAVGIERFGEYGGEPLGPSPRQRY